MAKPLDERIAAALGASSRLTDVEALIAELTAEIAAVARRRDEQEARSVDPDVSAAEARQARDAALDIAHDHRRLTAFLGRLEDRKQTILADESYAERRRQYEAARDRRDALAERIRQVYPEIVRTLMALVEEIDASDAECQTANRDKPRHEPWLESAEALARECPETWVWPDGISPVVRLRKMQLPFPSCGGFALPRKTFGDEAVDWRARRALQFGDVK